MNQREARMDAQVTTILQLLRLMMRPASVVDAAVANATESSIPETGGSPFLLPLLLLPAAHEMTV